MNKRQLRNTQGIHLIYSGNMYSYSNILKLYLAHYDEFSDLDRIIRH